MNPTVLVVPAELKPYPTNYNIHPPEQIGELARSLADFEQVKNIVTWRGYILAGHGLVEAALQSNLPLVEARDVSDWPAEKAEAFLIADNETARLAQPDYARMQGLVNQVKAGGVETIAGVTPARLAEIVAEAQRVNGKPGRDVEPQLDRAAQLREKWGTAVGQVWELGAHRLACGDCTDRAIGETVACSDRISFIYIDPPYSVSYADKNRSLNSVAKGNGIQTPIENDHLEVREAAEKIWRPAFTNLFDLAQPGCAYYCSAPQGGDQMMMMMMMLCESGWLVKHEIIWVKNNHVLGRADYQYKHEPIIYGWKPGAGHYFIDSRSELSVWEIDKPHNSDFHPTTKPLGLVERAMRNSSRPGDICADFFVGSGTTVIAGENLGRKVRAIELDPGYVAVTLQRWADVTGQEPHLL